MNKNNTLRLIDLAKNRLKNPVSKDMALNTFIKAGILDTNANFTKNYPNLSAFLTRK